MGVHSGVTMVNGSLIAYYQPGENNRRQTVEQAIKVFVALLAQEGATMDEETQIVTFANGLTDNLGELLMEYKIPGTNLIWRQIGDSVSGNWAAWVIVLAECDMEVYPNDPNKPCMNMAELAVSSVETARLVTLLSLLGWSESDIERSLGTYVLAWVS